MTKKDKVKWIKALRSGEYKQARGILHDEEDNSYCCLGVARKIGLCRASPIMPDKVSYNFLDSDTQDDLISLNDDENKSFKKIADYIEKNL